MYLLSFMKRIFFLLVLISLSTLVKAQEFNIGAKAGLNLSTITGLGEDYNPRLAYHFGGFAKIPLTDKLSLNPELLYLSIGTTFNFNENQFNGLDPLTSGLSFRSVTRDNFLAVPINFRYNFTNRFGLDFGPQINFLFNSVNKVKDLNTDSELTGSKVSGNFRPDYGASLGLTFSMSEKINLQLRYYQGLKNLNGGSFNEDERRQNIALQLSVGYVIF